MSYTPRPLFASFLGLAVALSSLSSVVAADMHAAIAAQNKVTRELMRTPGILGTAVGLTADGQASLVVYVDENSKHAPGLVAQLNRPDAAIPVQVELTEQFRAYRKP